MEEQIKEFLSIPFTIYGYGNGDGYGDGSGYGNGDGDGYGDGSGYGNGDGNGSGRGSGSGYGSGNGDGYGNGNGSGSGNGNGYGYGSGDGSGNGDGIKIFNNQNVYRIDDITTIISSIRNNIAKGFILQSDFTLTPCYVVKQDNYFSHGSTLKGAFESLQEKLYQNASLKERIIKFKNKFVDFKAKYPASELFIWHNILTGSCKMGRESFVKDHNINIQTDTFTIYEFIELTKNSYNGRNIKLLLE